MSCFVAMANFNGIKNSIVLLCTSSCLMLLQMASNGCDIIRHEIGKNCMGAQRFIHIYLAGTVDVNDSEYRSQ